MKYYTHLIIAILFISYGCKTTNQIGEVSNPQNIDIGLLGHMKLDLIDYEIVDSTELTEDKAALFISFMSPQFKSEVVFNAHRTADLIFNELDSIYIRRSLFDNLEQLNYQFFEKDSMKYYSIDSIKSDENMLDLNEEDSIKVSQMFKFRTEEEVDSVMFGFKCSQLKIMNPENFELPYMMMYLADEIPFIFDVASKMGFGDGSGMPLLGETHLMGLKITVGVVEHNPMPSLDLVNFLSFDPKEYQLVSPDRLRKIIEGQ